MGEARCCLLLCLTRASPEGAGVPWVVATVRTLIAYTGHGPELTFGEGVLIDVIKVNNTSWWKGLMGRDAVPGLFPCQSVALVKLHSAPMDSLVMQLRQACCVPDGPVAKLKMAMGAAIFDRGVEEFTALQTKVWLDSTEGTMPFVYPSSCHARFVLDATDAPRSSTVVRFTCPDRAESALPEVVRAVVTDPRLGPNLVGKLSVVVEPREFELRPNEEVDVVITVELLTGELEAECSIVVPVAFASAGSRVKGAAGDKTCRYYLLVAVTTAELRLREQRAMLIKATHELDDEHDDDDHELVIGEEDPTSAHNSEIWGETMSSKDLGQGMKELLSELFVMPPTKKGLTPPRGMSPRSPPRSPPSSRRAETVAALTSPPIKRAVSSVDIVKSPALQRVSSSPSRPQRSASTGFADDDESHKEQRGAAAAGGGGVLANVRARLNRGRSQSTDELRKKSPRSPRDPKSPRDDSKSPRDDAKSPRDVKPQRGSRDDAVATALPPPPPPLPNLPPMPPAPAVFGSSSSSSESWATASLGSSAPTAPWPRVRDNVKLDRMSQERRQSPVWGAHRVGSGVFAQSLSTVDSGSVSPTDTGSPDVRHRPQPLPRSPGADEATTVNKHLHRMQQRSPRLSTASDAETTEELASDSFK